MALNDVAAEWTAGGGGQLKIDACAGSERPERSAVEGFLCKVGVEVGGIGIEGGETDAGDSERVTFAQPRGDAESFDCDAANATAIGEADERSGLLDDACEHGLILGSEPPLRQGPVAPPLRDPGRERGCKGLRD